MPAVDHMILEELKAIRGLLEKLAGSPPQPTPPPTTKATAIEVEAKPVEIEKSIPYSDLQAQAKYTLEDLSTILGWGDAKILAMSVRHKLLQSPYSVARAKVNGAGKPPRQTWVFTDAGREALRKLWQEEQDSKTLVLTPLETDVVMVAERLGATNCSPVYLSGPDLVELGLPHGSGSMDRCILSLIKRGIFTAENKPADAPRGKLVYRTSAPVLKHPGAYLMKEARKAHATV